MADPDTSLSRPPANGPRRGGGIFIAAGLVLGAIAGWASGEPSLGLIVGLGVGVLAAIVLAVGDRR